MLEPKWEKLFFNLGKLFFNLKAFFQPWKSFFQPCRSFFQPWKAFFSTLPNFFFTLPGSFQPWGPKESRSLKEVASKRPTVLYSHSLHARQDIKQFWCQSGRSTSMLLDRIYAGASFLSLHSVSTLRLDLAASQCSSVRAKRHLPRPPTDPEACAGSPHKTYAHRRTQRSEHKAFALHHP